MELTSAVDAMRRYIDPKTNFIPDAAGRVSTTEMPGGRLLDDWLVNSWPKRRGGIVKKHCRRAGIETYRLNQAHGIFCWILVFSFCASVWDLCLKTQAANLRRCAPPTQFRDSRFVRPS